MSVLSTLEMYDNTYYSFPVSEVTLDQINFLITFFSHVVDFVNNVPCDYIYVYYLH